MDRAVRASVELAVERETLRAGGTPGPRSREAEELARREIELAERWMRMRMGVDNPAFPSREQAKNLVMREMLQFYQMQSQQQGGG
jgi:hypothetical protein